MAMHLIPHELYIGEVFFPPMLLNAALGLVAAMITARQIVSGVTLFIIRRWC
jgi:hypothetical protein